MILYINSSDSSSLLPLESSFDEPRFYQCLCQITSENKMHHTHFFLPELVFGVER